MLKVFLVWIGFLSADPPPVFVVPYMTPKVCIGIEMPLHCMVAPFHDPHTQDFCA